MNTRNLAAKMHKILKNCKNKNQLTFCASCAFLWLFFIAANSAFAYSGGDGTPNNPYQIADVNNLLQLGADVNNYDKCFILTADINLAGITFNDAVIAPGDYYSPAFTGSFDGAGHKISNLTINASGESAYYYGLFGHTNPSYYDEFGNSWSEIKNVTLESVHITISFPSGYSEIIGGLIGDNSGTPITNCHSTVLVTSVDCGGSFGGLVGYNNGNINNCSSEGSVFINPNLYVHGVAQAGGLIGFNEAGNIIYSHSDCNVICNANWNPLYSLGFVWVGGLVGRNDYYYQTITSDCYSTGVVGGNNNALISFIVGGLFGENQWPQYSDQPSFINRCFSTSHIIVTGDGSNQIGGLVGKNVGEVNDCYSIGSVTGPDSEIGGLVGDNYGIIRNCYSVGKVTASGSSKYVGGLVGYGESSIINGYFLDVNGPDNGNGLGTPLTDAQMKQQSSFVGWDFVGETINGTEDAWRMCENSVRYPLLSWQFPAADFTCPDGVDFTDFAVLADWWQFNNCADNNNCDKTDMDLSGTVDIYDLKIFCDNWLLSH